MMKKADLKEATAFNRVSIPDIILLSMYSSLGRSREAAFEKVLAECFSLSPQTLSFPRHSRWPDARKIDRPLRSLRRKGLIKGSPDTVFSLTRKGRQRAEEITKALRQRKLFRD